MRIAVCQPTEIRGDINAAVAIIEHFVRSAQDQQVDLICFPECFLGGYFLHSQAAQKVAFDLKGVDFQKITKKLSRYQPQIVVGLSERAGQELYNTAVVLQQGELVGVYRKQHLLKAEQHFTAGVGQPVFELSNRKLGINICYDNQFPTAATKMVKDGATVILCPSNNMLPTHTAERWKNLHNPCRAQRAREHGCWYISSDVTGTREGHLAYGPTAAIDPNGKLIAQLPLGKEGMLVLDIE